MRKAAIYALITLTVLALIYLVTLLYPVHNKENPSQKLKEAEGFYTLGEKATSTAQRKAAFNRALQDLQQLEDTYGPAFGNGKIYYDLANTNFQLEEYPMAAYFYYRTLSLNPRDADASRNLDRTLQKLGLAPHKEDQVFRRVLFFHELLSLPEQLAWFFFASLAAIGFSSLYIWLPYGWLKVPIALSLLAVLVMLGSLLYTKYLTPLEGVVVKAALLYRDAGTQYAKVSEKPISPGSKVDVLDSRDDGHWLKIKTAEGVYGYVAQDRLRII